MRWLIITTLLLIAVGSTFLWYSFIRTQPKPQHSLPPLTYKDPYVKSSTQQSHDIAVTTKPQPTPQHTTAPQQSATRSSSAPIPAIAPEPTYDRRAMENLFFAEVNRQRVIRNLEPLTLRKDLARTARKYSKELATATQQDPSYDPRTAVVELRHLGTSFGRTVIERLHYKDVYDMSRAGENILSIPLDLSTYDDNGHLLKRQWRTPDDVVNDGVRAWILSPKHRTNILTPSYTHGGIGIYRLDNILVVTQIFITQADCGYYKGPCCTTTPTCFNTYTCDYDRTEPECRKSN